MDNIDKESIDNVEHQLRVDLFADNNEPYEDSGSEYLPTRSPSPLSLILAVLLEDSENNEEQHKARKRKRVPKKWMKNVRKEKRRRGEQYVNIKGNLVPPKQININLTCLCAKKCPKKISPIQQNKLFESFYKLESFDLQTSYLFSLIKVEPKKKITPNDQASLTRESRRSNSRVHQVPNSNGIQTTVCKSFFKNIFQGSDGRLTRVVKNKLIIPTPPSDKRGKHNPKNKTSDGKFQGVKSFIELFPRYESHYTLHKSTERKFLAPDLNLNKMYSLYCTQNTEPVSYFIFRKIFNENFNLSFHTPISDSCKKCDNLEIKMKASDSVEEKNQLTTQKQIHLAKADSARINYTKYKELANINRDITVIVFDLMKTLPTPVISTSICYYKRQLWTYCLGIHNEVNNNVTMCVWNETVASRGPQEIGSCLLRYIKENVHTKKLILYSDQCGGQNRNIKMATICQYITAHPDFVVEFIDHKFYVSGHSYLACDQDFGLIEKRKKMFKNLFVPDDWCEVITAARNKNPFNIMKMTKNHFYSTKNLERNITNRKMTAEGSKMKWLKIHPFKILFKYSNNEKDVFQQVNCAKRNSKNIASMDLNYFYPEGKPISAEKKKDLKDLLHYIPPVHHDFYYNIKESTNVQNDAGWRSSDSD